MKIKENQEKKLFGEKKSDKKYITRVGIYAIIFDTKKEKLAIVKTSSGYFLPGGGLNENEDHRTCLQREALEEMGWEIEIGYYLGNGGSYYYSGTKDNYYFSDGYFYYAKKRKTLSEPLEIGHEVFWLTSTEAIEKLYHKNQRWAVEQSVKQNIQ